MEYPAHVRDIEAPFFPRFDVVRRDVSVSPLLLAPCGQGPPNSEG
jgi:hypothetical protein